MLLWYKSYNLKDIFCILSHKRSGKKKKKDMAMKFFFHLHGKCGSPVNTVYAVSKEKTWLKERYVSVKFKIIGIKIVKKKVTEM